MKEVNKEGAAFVEMGIEEYKALAIGVANAEEMYRQAHELCEHQKKEFAKEKVMLKLRADVYKEVLQDVVEALTRR